MASQTIFSSANEAIDGFNATFSLNRTAQRGDMSMKGLRPSESDSRPIVGLTRNSTIPTHDCHRARERAVLRIIKSGQRVALIGGFLLKSF